MFTSPLKSTPLVLLLLLFLVPPAWAQTSIQSVVHSARKPLLPGDTIHIIMVGSPGGQAEVEIMGNPGTEPMTETSSGRYEANIVIPSGLNVNDESLLVTLRRGGQTDIAQSDKGVTILPGNVGVNPSPPTRPSSMTANTVSPAPGSTVDPLHWGQLRLSAEFPVPVDNQSVKFTVNGLDVSRQSIVDSNNAARNEVVWLTRGRVPSGQVLVQVSALGVAGQSLSESWNFNMPGSNPGMPTGGNSIGAVKMTPAAGSSHARLSNILVDFPVSVDPNTVILKVNGRDVSRQAINDSQNVGRSQVAWNNSLGNLSGPVQIELHAVGLRGEKLQQNWNFTVGNITVTPPVNPTPSQRLGVSNIQNGMLLGSKFQVVGSGIPGSNVLATVEFPKRDFLSQLAGIMLKFQGQATVDSNGRYSIDLDAGGVKRGQPMTITVSDSSRSTPVILTTERGQDNLQQSNAVATAPPAAQPKPFFDSADRYGFNIAPGWTQSNNDPNMDIKVVKGNHSAFSVMVRPANGKTVDDGVAEMSTVLTNGGAKVTNVQPIQISGFASKAMLVLDKSGEEGVLTCTVANGKFYHAIVTSTQLSSDPDVKKDLDQMLTSFFIR